VADPPANAKAASANAAPFNSRAGNGVVKWMATDHKANAAHNPVVKPTANRIAASRPFHHQLAKAHKPAPTSPARRNTRGQPLPAEVMASAKVINIR